MMSLPSPVNYLTVSYVCRLRGLLGCDLSINYKEEDLKQLLREEYPKGVDVVYESVGGETFNTSVKCLATKGRLIVIGFIGNYQDSFT